MSPVIALAHAKLALTLRITGVRDDGYHLIDAEMVSLEWADTLTIDRDGEGITADGPFAAGMPLDDRNLVAKALRLADRSAAVHLHKAIPHGAGLGGGSSDAAAVLRWAGYTDVVGASRVGADVSFCLVGGRARVRGIGELVKPLEFRIDIDRAGQIFWDGAVVDRATLDANMIEAAKYVPQPNMMIRPDKAARYEAVAFVLANSQRRGLQKIAIVGGEQFR